MYEDVYIDYSCSKKYAMIREMLSLSENIGVDLILFSSLLGGGVGVFFNLDEPFRGFSLFGLMVIFLYVFILFVWVLKKNYC